MAHDLGRCKLAPRPGVAAARGIVRVAALLGVQSLLRERGVDPADVLASIGLDPRTLDDADNRIPHTTAGQLLRRCAETTGCVHFGLLVGANRPISRRWVC